MSKRSVTHATFTIERTYDASPARVFSAWADAAAKARWFGSSDEWRTDEYKLDFRVGGREVYRGAPKGGGQVHAFNGHYQDIVPDERIVYTYDMHMDDKRISVSLATVELKPAGKGTRLIFTEQAPSSTASTSRRCASTARRSCWTRWARSCSASRLRPDRGK